MRIKKMKGDRLSRFLVMIVLVIGLVVGLQMVQKNQENRSNAAGRFDFDRCRLNALKFFSNQEKCDNNGFRYVSYTCWDGYIGKLGSSSSCKSKQIWKQVADTLCLDRCNVSIIATPTPALVPTQGEPTPTPTPIPVSNNGVNLILDSEDTSLITADNLNKWNDRLNTAYKNYAELTGYVPYNGGQISVKSYSCNVFSSLWDENTGACKYWAWAGQIIGWAKPYVKDELARVNDNDDWSFGILHEIGHIFDKYNWSFDSELMANFKMAYVVEINNANVSPGYSRVYYTGSELINAWKPESENGYDYAIKNNVYTGNFMNYILLKIKDQIGGWATYKKVFRNMSTKSFNSNKERLDGFMNEISLVSGISLNTLLSDQERAIIATFK